MDRAVIIGAWGILGFHLSKRILEEGIEVDGIHLDIGKNNHLIEEKRLEIGRNANFTELDMDFDISVSTQKGTVLFIDFYDVFMWKKEKQLLENERIRELLHEFRCEEGKVIFLLPIMLISCAQLEDIHTKLLQQIAIIKKKGRSVQSFYLPTVYGHWPSEYMAFDKESILIQREFDINNRESLGMEDAINAILELVMKKDAI